MGARAWTGPTALALLAGLGCTPAEASTHRCVDAQGRVTLSDRPCPVVAAPTPPPAEPPCSLSPEQRRVAERLEDQFLRRFPTEATHRAATVADLQVIVSRLRQTQARLADLQEKRRKIDQEIEFHPDYPRVPLPPDLVRRLDESEALFGATADVFRAIEHDIGLLMSRAACERKQFAALWQGAARGSSACAAACS